MRPIRKIDSDRPDTFSVLDWRERVQTTDLHVKPGFHIVVIVVIQSAIIADQVFQQLRLNGNTVAAQPGGLAGLQPPQK